MDLKEHQLFKIANYARHPWESARRLIIKRLFDSYFEENCLESKFVLDVGCGDGYVVSHLALHYPNYQFVGLDINFNKEDINFFTCLYPYENIRFTSEMIYTLNGPIDSVLLLDVLEHVDNDGRFLKSLVESNNISKDTLYIITVPAFNTLFSNHDRALNHYRRYNAKELRELVGQNGLHVVECGYFFLSPLIIRCFELIKERLTSYKQKKIGVSRYEGKHCITKLIEKFLYADACMCVIFNKLHLPIWGLTCYAICRKLA